MSSSACPEVRPSEITPKAVWLRRRELLAGAAALGSPARWPSRPRPLPGGGQEPAIHRRAADQARGHHQLQQLLRVRHRQGRSRPRTPHSSRPQPWTVKVDGLVGKPADYRARGHPQAASRSRSASIACAASRRWSMVIPWVGFPLADLLKRVEPQGGAKYVAFETLVRPAEMPGQQRPLPAADWPYVEGLRLDEAMHPLTILAVGLYGETLPNQNGAPIRLVVPWKYGFKSIKSIVRISLVEKQPPTTWNKQNAERVRLLFQRQSRGRPSALEPGDRAPDRRGRPVRQAPPDAAVQRLWRSGGRASMPAWTCERTTDDARRPTAAAARGLPWYQSPAGRLYVIGLIPAVWTFYLGRRRPARRRSDEGARARPRPVGAEIPGARPRDHAAAAARPASACCATAARSGCSPSSMPRCT